MEGLSQGERSVIFKNSEIPILSKSCLRVIQIKENELQVELYAYKEGGEKISFGKKNIHSKKY
jgi:hypothetical protein